MNLNKKKCCLSAFMIIMFLLTVMILLIGCRDEKEIGKNQTERLINSVEQLADKRIGVEGGAVYDSRIKEMFPDAEMMYVGSSADAIVAMQNKKIDAFIADEPLAKFIIEEVPGITYLSEMLTFDDYAFVLKKGNTELAEEINTVLAELEAEGILETLRRKWIEKEEIQEVNHNLKADTSKGKLKVITSADIEPFSFIQNGKLAGYDIELITLIAERMGYAVTIDNAEFATLIPAVNGGKYDVAVGCITITKERAETLLFTEPVYHSGTVAIVEDGTAPGDSLGKKLTDSFRRTFIIENRWKMVCEGMAVTLMLSLASAVLGTILGFLFSFPLRSHNKVVRTAANGIRTLWDAMPLVVVLMGLYYIVFKSIDISAIAVGIFGFSLDFANVVAGILNTGVLAVNKGEMEAAEAMGYSKSQTFCKIIFPQVVHQMFAQYEGAIVELVKGTAIVGYITVEDLTKVGDIIRSRTYEAFFPLIAIAALYFVIAYTSVFLLEKVSVHFNPRHRVRRLKGVRSE